MKRELPGRLPRTRFRTLPGCAPRRRGARSLSGLLGKTVALPASFLPAVSSGGDNETTSTNYLIRRTSLNSTNYGCQVVATPCNRRCSADGLSCGRGGGTWPTLMHETKMWRFWSSRQEGQDACQPMENLSHAQQTSSGASRELCLRCTPPTTLERWVYKTTKRPQEGTPCVDSHASVRQLPCFALPLRSPSPSLDRVASP